MVLIDMGHGVDTKGKEYEGFKEYLFNRKVGEFLQDELHKRKIPFSVLVSTEYDMDVRVRADLAGDIPHDLLVSIHGNAFEKDLDVNGIETHYYSAKGKEAALIMQKSLINRTGWGDRGIRKSNFWMLKKTPKPAILTESGFYTNEVDRILMNAEYWQYVIAKAHADGIQEIMKLWKL